jgi:hypothetical protein
MRRSEIKKLVSTYNEIKRQIKKRQNKKLAEKLKEIEHKYFHETRRTFQSDFKEII